MMFWVAMASALSVAGAVTGAGVVTGAGAMTGADSMSGAGAVSGAVQQSAADDGVCHATPAQALVGERYRRHLPTRARQLSGARLVRRVSPGDVTTQEFREDRVTVRVDHRRVVTGVTCG